VVKGVPNHRRDYYLLWEEKKAPDLAIELTSKSTRAEDVKDKFALYQDTLKVAEYFLFDPYAEYLRPPLRGHRLRKGRYVPIKPVKDRLPSRILGLHLEGNGTDLRLYNPDTGEWLPTPKEELARSEAAREREAAEREQGAVARRQAEAEVERLRRDPEALRRDWPGTP
jgi:Uma2 family endonuclease